MDQMGFETVKKTDTQRSYKISDKEIVTSQLYDYEIGNQVLASTVVCANPIKSSV